MAESDYSVTINADTYTAIYKYRDNQIKLIKLGKTKQAAQAYKVLKRELKTRFEHVPTKTGMQLITALDNSALRIEETFVQEVGLGLDKNLVRAMVRKFL